MRGYFSDIFSGVWTVLVGMRLTFRHLFTRAVTLQYPDEKWELPPGARGQLFNDIDDCIGCDKCARICPVDCIYIETVKVGPGEDLSETTTGHKKRLHVVRFDIDMSKCCYCALCVYPCPTECLVMTPEYESSVYDRDDFIYRYATYTPEEVEKIKEEGAKRDVEMAAKKAAAAKAKAEKAKAEGGGEEKPARVKASATKAAGKTEGGDAEETPKPARVKPRAAEEAMVSGEAAQKEPTSSEDEQ